MHAADRFEGERFTSNAVKRSRMAYAASKIVQTSRGAAPLPLHCTKFTGAARRVKHVGGFKEAEEDEISCSVKWGCAELAPITIENEMTCTHPR